MTPPSNGSVVVIPCFNEERRLDTDAFASLAASGATNILFVNDGSTDATGHILDSFVDETPGCDVLHLQRNVGKGEAIRRGLVSTLDHGSQIVGFLDADLSTPTDEYLRLLALMREEPELHVVMGSRVALLGTHIHRRSGRHYLGRAFGTLASVGLGMVVYDTQCGAKVFRRSPALDAAVSVPFRSRWVFDVELLGRLHDGVGGAPGLDTAAFRELPLLTWTDVPGGTLGLAGMSRSLYDLGRVIWHRRRTTRQG